MSKRIKSKQGLTSPTILVAEDEPVLLESLAELLGELSCKVIPVKNGQELVDKVSSEMVHAVLSDINMPLKSGIDALAEIRQLGFETPFVFLTGYGDATNVSSALKLGAFDFHEKPFDDVQVLDTMKQALEYGLALEDLELKIENLLSESQVPESIKNQLQDAHKKIGSIRIMNRMKRWK